MVTIDRPYGQRAPLSPLDRLARALAVTVAALGVLHLLTYLCWFAAVCVPGPGLYNGAGRLLDLTAEQSIPNWLATVLLAGIALAPALSAAISPQGRNGWWGLAGLFAYLSLDEATDLHGYWILLLGDATIPGIAYGFNWIIPGAVITLAVALAFRSWLLERPPALRREFLRAGAVYVAGGLVLKVVGALTAGEDFRSPLYLTVSTLEELLELAGIVLMLRATLGHLLRHLHDLPEPR